MHTRKFLGAFAAALLVSTGARADESGFYLGAGVGRATQSSFQFHGEDTSFRWLAGYSFNKYLAAEAGFVDGGTQKDHVGALYVKSSANGAFATVLARLPLGKVVAPYAKIGYVFYDATATATGNAIRFSERTSDDDLLYGAGLEFRLSEHFRLRADYEKIDVPDVAFDIYSIVATYRF
jgi:opacity protein-like surface antigen